MKSWDPAALWLKAKQFVDRANESEQSSTEFALNSAFALECLARAALTHIHPVLNADPRDDLNLLYGCGFDLTANPRSLPAHSVYLRLEKIVNGFGKMQRELCEFVALQRNGYLHTAQLPYDNLGTNRWLPRYYETVAVLNNFMGKTLVDFLGPDVAEVAEALVKSLNEDLKKNVKSRVAAYLKVWQSKGETERKALRQVADSAAIMLSWGEVARGCPVCQSQGKLSGHQVKQFPERYVDGELLMDVQFLATAFKCAACGLALKGTEEIAHAELDTHFVVTTATSLHELYEPEYYIEYNNM